MVGTAVEAGPPLPALRLNIKSELRRDHNLLPEGSQCFAYQFFIYKWAIGLGCVKKGDTPFHSRPDKRDHLLLVGGRAVSRTHSHAAQPEGRDFQATIAKFTFLH